MQYFSIAVDQRRDFYITGGYSGNENEPSSRASVLNIDTLEQKELPDLNQARFGHSSLILDGRLFVMGGMTSASDDSSSIECLGIAQ